MSDHGFSEEQVAVALEHAGPLEEEDLRALAQVLELELTDQSRQAQFRRTMQFTVAEFALSTLRQAYLPHDDSHDLLKYLSANPGQLPAFLRRELADSPRFRENLVEPALRQHLLTDGPSPDDRASMVELIDWMRMRISELHSTIGRRRGRRRTNVTLETFIAHLARVALALGKEVTRPTHADQPERNSFFRFVDKAVAFGCMAAKEALQQAGGIPEASRAKVIKDLDRMMALRDRGLSDAIRKGLARLPADATKSRRKIRCRTRDFSA